jgi:hypothetical protein
LTRALPNGRAKARPDPTNALRSRRWRQRQKANAANGSATDGATVVTTIQMCALAARVGAGLATSAELDLAERLIMALVNRLPADSTIDIG